MHERLKLRESSMKWIYKDVVWMGRQTEEFRTQQRRTEDNRTAHRTTNRSSSNRSLSRSTVWGGSRKNLKQGRRHYNERMRASPHQQDDEGVTATMRGRGRIRVYETGNQIRAVTDVRCSIRILVGNSGLDSLLHVEWEVWIYLNFVNSFRQFLSWTHFSFDRNYN